MIGRKKRISFPISGKKNITIQNIRHIKHKNHMKQKMKKEKEQLCLPNKSQTFLSVIFSYTYTEKNKKGTLKNPRENQTTVDSNKEKHRNKL